MKKVEHKYLDSNETCDPGSVSLVDPDNKKLAFINNLKPNDKREAIRLSGDAFWVVRQALAKNLHRLDPKTAKKIALSLSQDPCEQVLAGLAQSVFKLTEVDSIISTLLKAESTCVLTSVAGFMTWSRQTDPHFIRLMNLGEPVCYGLASNINLHQFPDGGMAAYFFARHPSRHVRQAIGHNPSLTQMECGYRVLKILSKNDPLLVNPVIKKNIEKKSSAKSVKASMKLIL